MSGRQRPALLLSVCGVAWAGLASAQAPLVHDTLTAGGLVRDFYVARPARVDSARGAPLVIFLHGGGGSARGAAERYGFTGVAGGAGAIVVYPDGVDHHWNDGRDAFHSGDDVAFIRALVARLRKQERIDPRRIYAAGHSNGAMMAYTLACRAPGVFAAIGTVGGEIPVNDVARCANAHPISVIAIHGTDDPLVPYDGGGIRGAVLGAEQSARFWSKVDGCAQTPTDTALPPPTRTDSTRAFLISYSDCRDARAVVLYKIQGAGHGWPGRPEMLPESVVGPHSDAVDATAVIWGFFVGNQRP